MTAVAEVSPVTAGYLAALREIAHPAGGTVQIGDARRPEGPSPAPNEFYPYAVLYVGTSLLDGNLLAVHQDGLHRLQVTSVGRDRVGAEWLRDRTRAVLLDRDIDIDDHAVVWAEFVTGQPVQRDDDVQPPLFYAIDVVNVLVTPVLTGS